MQNDLLYDTAHVPATQATLSVRADYDHPDLVVSRKLDDAIRRQAFQDDLPGLQAGSVEARRQVVKVGLGLESAYLPLERIGDSLQAGWLLTFYHLQQRQAGLKGLGKRDGVRKHTLGQEGSVERN
jgi:hypothetical protein